MTPTPEDALFSKLSAAPPAPAPELRPQPDSSKPVTARNLFFHPHTHPVVLDFAMKKAFGEEWLGWEGETIFAEVKRIFGTQISELCRHKLRALQVLRTSPLLWLRWQVFEKVAHTLNGTLPLFKVVQTIPLEDLYGAVDIINTLRQEKFADEVRLYMAAVSLHEDVFLAIPPLEFLQPYIAQPFLHCHDCGNHEPALSRTDHLCSNCTGRMDPQQGLSLEPDPKKVEAGKGKNTTLEFRHSPVAAKKVWDAWGEKPFEAFQAEHEKHQEDPGWVQAGKLIMAREYLNLRRRQLAEQLTSLKGWLGAA